MGEGLPKVSLPATGVSCAACARRVEKALSGAEGVSAASMNLAAEKVPVEYDPAAADPEDLIRTVEEAPYDSDAWRWDKPCRP